MGTKAAIIALLAIGNAGDSLKGPYEHDISASAAIHNAGDGQQRKQVLAILTVYCVLFL